MGRLGTNFMDAENWPNSLELERLLTDIGKEFRYKRRNSVGSPAASAAKPVIQQDSKDTSKDESPSEHQQPPVATSTATHQPPPKLSPSETLLAS